MEACQVSGADNFGPKVESVFGRFMQMQWCTSDWMQWSLLWSNGSKNRLIIHCGSVLHAAGVALIYTSQPPSCQEEIRSTLPTLRDHRGATLIFSDIESLLGNILSFHVPQGLKSPAAFLSNTPARLLSVFMPQNCETQCHWMLECQVLKIFQREIIV